MTRTSSKSAGIRKIPSVASPLRAMIWLIVKMVKMMMVAMMMMKMKMMKMMMVAMWDMGGGEEAIPGR